MTSKARRVVNYYLASRAVSSL